jgi:hypothetical protein
MVPLPIYTRISKRKVKCDICGIKIICRKLTRGYLSSGEIEHNITTKDWVCVICESKYIIGDYAKDVPEGSC